MNPTQVDRDKALRWLNKNKKTEPEEPTAERLLELKKWYADTVAKKIADSKKKKEEEAAADSFDESWINEWEEENADFTLRLQQKHDEDIKDADERSRRRRILKKSIFAIPDTIGEIYSQIGYDN